MAVKNVRDSIELALAIGIDTGKEILCDSDRTKGIKPISSDEVEAFCSELKQCDENSKFVIFDTLSGLATPTSYKA